MILADSELNSKDANKMMTEIKDLDGVTFALGLDSAIGNEIPKELIPESLKSELVSDKHQIMMVGSDYKVASDEINNQITTIQDIAKKYDSTSMVIGEAPCTKDLITITDTDFKRVSAVSIGAIVVIILLVFKSISLPVVLVAAIEFAIFINMGLP